MKVKWIILNEVIRSELLTKPSLSLDLLCGLPRVSGLEKLMKDIMRLDAADRMKYAMFLIDMDNLKAQIQCYLTKEPMRLLKMLGKY